MQDMGYTFVKWIANPGACHICRDLDGQTWDLTEFIDTTDYDAPMFSRSHVNCLCSIICSGPGLEDRVVMWDGVQ